MRSKLHILDTWLSNWTENHWMDSACPQKQHKRSLPAELRVEHQFIKCFKKLIRTINIIFFSD